MIRDFGGGQALDFIRHTSTPRYCLVLNHWLISQVEGRIHARTRTTVMAIYIVPGQGKANHPTLDSRHANPAPVARSNICSCAHFPPELWCPPIETIVLYVFSFDLNYSVSRNATS